MRSRHEDVARLASLAAELCDAHLDTIYMVRNEDLGLDWTSHIEYLQRLRRMTERAHASAPSDVPVRAPTNG
jgi:hypothetical protein